VLGGSLDDRPERPWKLAVTYALSTLAVAFEGLPPEGGLLVAPVGAPNGPQELLRVDRRSGLLRRETHGAVRYVSEWARA
jgi:protein-L-isoaspartate(D-aspartate) O-methyltransferase